MAVVVIALDQWFKSYFPSQLNTGVSFSVLSKTSPLILNSLMGMFLLAVMGMSLRAWLLKPTWWWSVLLVAGGFSNLIDRVQLGGVRDIWPIPFTSLSNNFADYLIFFGFLGMMATLWKEEASRE